MIKIPGTPEGAKAIEQAIYEGININVTLLFAVEAYETVAEAYLRALERRQADGLSLDVHSVASFFVSRVDTNVDKRLQELGRTELAGTAGAGQRARGVPPLPGDLLRAAVGGAAPRRCVGAAPAVGLDRGQEPRLPGHDVRRRAGRAATPSTRCRWRRCTPSPITRRSSGPTAEQDPSEDLDALREAGIDLGAVTDELLRGRDRAVRGGDGPTARRDRAASARRCSPAGRRRSPARLPPDAARSPSRARASGDRGAGRRARVAPRRVAVGRDRACRRSATGSAG